MDLSEYGVSSTQSFDDGSNQNSVTSSSSTAASSQASSKKKPTIEEYELGKTLGEGAYGKVMLAKEKKTGQMVAVKTVS